MEKIEWVGDEQILLRMASGVRRSRVRARLTQALLARQAGVSKRTVERLEAGNSIQLAHWLRVLRVLDLLNPLLAIWPNDEPSPLQLLRAKTNEPQRVRSSNESESKWTWGEE